MGNHAKESIDLTKHKVELPNSKTINIEGMKFKYEIHYDQLDDKDLLTIERYANHIFHAYQARYGLDVSTDYTFKGFIYNSLTDLRNARPGHNTAYAGASFHHYPHKSGSVAHDLTEMIYFTLNFYNKQSRNIPIPKGNFIRDVEKELKAIRLDDNQEESNTAEKPETTINQEEPKKIEPSGSGEEEKIKLDEEKSGQEKISPEKHKVVLPNSKTINIEGTKFKYEIHHDQLDDKDLLMIEKYANHIFHACQEKYGLDINTDHTFKGFIYNSLTDLRNARPGHNTAYAGASFHHYHYSNGSIAYNLTSAIESTLTLYNQEKRGIPYPEGRYTFITDVAKELKAIKLDDNQEEPKKIEPSGSEEEEKSKAEEKKSGQEEISPEEHQTINQEEPKRIEPSGSGGEEKIKLDEEKSGQEEISPEKHKVVLPNSRTINIEGTKFKYEIHYDQLDDKDLLMIEKYANYIFHAYQERYDLDINTDHTFKGFIYNSSTDLRSGPYATVDNHHYPYTSGSIARYLTEGIYLTLNLYNMENHDIPYHYPESTFIKDVEKELKAIRLDGSQEELNTEEKSETTINQEKQEEELGEQDVITITDHPLDDYNHDHHLIG